MLSFNPRAHAGRDTCRGAHHVMPGVSIHAPTRGATTGGPLRSMTGKGFNPRAHAGRDCKRQRVFCFWDSFNPRAHAGRDDNDLRQKRR